MSENKQMHVELSVSFTNRYPIVEEIRNKSPKLAKEISDLFYSTFKIPCRLEIKVIETETTTYSGITDFSTTVEEEHILKIAKRIQDKFGTVYVRRLQAEAQREVNLSDIEYGAVIMRLVMDGKLYSPKPDHLKLTTET